MSNEIKKVLYKEKPIAEKMGILGDPSTHLVYEAESTLGKLEFHIPMVEAEAFDAKMPAQLLIRWLV